MASPPIPDGLLDTRPARVANRLHSAAIHLLRRARIADRDTGVTPERLSVLSVIAFGGPRTVGELAEAEQVSAPAISRIVSALVEDGLARRERLRTDRRYVRIHATAEGRRLIEWARAHRLERIAEGLDRLDEDQLEALEAASEILETLERED